MADPQPASLSESSIAIRPAGESDMGGMIPMINAAFVVEDFIEGTRTDEARMSDLMRSGEFLIAEDGTGNILASVYTECTGEDAYLGMLAVNPSKQGTRLGRKITEAAEKRCFDRGARQMKITVLSQRSGLLAFYRKLGYREAGTEPFRPSRPLKPGVECHAIVMRKQL